MTIKKYFSSLFIVIFCFSSMVFSRPEWIKVLTRKMPDGSKKSVLVIGADHYKDRHDGGRNWVFQRDMGEGGDIGLCDQEDHSDYINEIRQFVGRRQGWGDTQISFLVEARPDLKFPTPPCNYALFFLEEELVRKFGRARRGACPFRVVNIDHRRAPQWQHTLHERMRHKYPNVMNPLAAGAISQGEVPSYFADADCGTVQRFAKHIQDYRNRMRELEQGFPEWLSRSELLEKHRRYIELVSGMYSPEMIAEFSRLHRDNRMQNHFDVLDRIWEGRCQLRQSPLMARLQQVKQEDFELVRIDSSPQYEMLAKMLMTVGRSLPKRVLSYSQTVMGVVHESSVPHVLFFDEVAHDQIHNDKTILCCGGAHANVVVQALIDCGYEVEFHRAEGAFDRQAAGYEGRILGSELRQWITGFCGFCNECGSASKQGSANRPVASCACCHFVKFCGRKCQLQAWGNRKKVGHHKQCCNKIGGSKIDNESEENGE